MALGDGKRAASACAPATPDARRAVGQRLLARARPLALVIGMVIVIASAGTARAEEPAAASATATPAAEEATASAAATARAEEATASAAATARAVERSSAATAPPSAARFEVVVGAAGRYSAGTTGELSDPGVAGGAAATLFVKPVVDDDTPTALQPCLQHASTLAFSVDAGVARRYLHDEPGQLVAPVTTAALAVAFDGRFGHTAVFAGAGYRRESATIEPRADRLPMELRVGLWSGDLRVDGGVRLSVHPDSGYVAASAVAELRVVFLEHIDLRIGAAAGAGGDAHVGAHVDTTYYASKRLGLSAGGWGGGGAFTDGSGRDFATFGLRAGASLSPTPRLRLAVEYAASWTTTDVAGAHASTLGLTVAARLP